MTFLHLKSFCIAPLALAPLIAAAFAPGWATVAQAADAPTPLPAMSPALYPGGKWQPGPARYGFTVEDDVAVKTNDGIILKASIAWPTDLATGKRAAGKFPVVVEHTPYVRLTEPLRPLTFFAERGYIYVMIHARGTGPSGGELGDGKRDSLDGRDIVDWAAHRLDGSDGRIALIGCSAPAGKALGDAAQLGPNSPVKAMVAACNGFHSQNRGSFMRGGMVTGNVRTLVQRILPYVGNSASAQRYYPGMVESIRSGGEMAYDGPAYADDPRTPSARQIVKARIPVLLWSGWQDRVEGAVRTYAALQNAEAGRPVGGPMGAAQKVSPRYQLVMGDFGHATGLDLGIFLEWIETWLKGADTGIQHTSTPMHLLEVGTDRWINLSRFPAVPVSTPWYLAPGQTLSTKPGAAGKELLIRREPDEKDGRLSFVTPVLANGATLSGPIAATIYARSSNTNLELVSRLFDVAGDGKETEIAMGVMLGSQRELDPQMSWTDARGHSIWPWPRLLRDDYLVPGKTYRFDIAMLSRQWGVAPGHRLRFELIGQSSESACGANPSTAPSRSRGMDPCDLTIPQQKTLPGGNYTILTGGPWASSVNLPQTRYKAFPAVRAAITPTPYNESRHKLDDKGVLLPLDWGH